MGWTVVYDSTASLAGTDDGGGNNGFNWRQVLSAAGLSAASGTSVRVTFLWGHLCSSSTVTFNASIGLKGVTSPNFAGDQVALKFSGGNSINVGADVSVTSDPATLAQTFDNTKDYVVANWLSDTAPATVSFAIHAHANEVSWQASVLSSTNDSNATTPTVTLTNVGASAIVVSKVEIFVASAALVPSWYSPFDSPARLLARPPGFADLETNIATQAVPPKQFQPFFDRVGLIPRPAGFVDQQASLNTIAQPIKQFPAFDPPSILKKMQPGFADLEVAAAAVVPVRVFASFDPPRSLTRPLPGFVEQPVPLPAVSIPMQAVAFDGPVRLRQPPDWQQFPVPVATPVVPPVFALAPSFDPPMRLLGLRVIETGFAYAPQIIVQPSVTLEIHNLPFHVTMGKLKSF